MNNRMSSRRAVLVLTTIAKLCVAVACMLGFGSGVADANDSAALKLVESKCVRCHGEKKHESGLNLSSIAEMQRGSESGPVFDPSNAEQGRLYELVKSGEMPPKGEGSLTPAERDSLLAWVTANNAQLAVSDSAATLQQVLPVFQLRCTACHGTRRKEGDLDLRTRESILRGGKSGPAIVSGDPENSLLLKRIHAEEMPPRRRLVEVSVKPMEAHEIDLVTRWIRQGANADSPEIASVESKVSDKDREFWAFQTPQQVPVQAMPQAFEDHDAITNPIDQFIVRKLAQNGLLPNGQASRRTLIRRLHLDLLGLPAQPDEIAEFVADQQPGAWSRLVDRVLASPRYGERWGGFWLDLAGYSDSEGIQHADPIRPEAWRYRDYVIRAFNDDKPYDRFLLEQIAGDELADYEHAAEITPEIYDNLVATGFLRMSEDATFAGITSFVPDRLEVIDDVLEVLTSSVMGLTIRCARCHDHKFDPIPQDDYYRLTGILKGALDENDWLKPTRQGGSPGTQDRYLKFVTTKERTEWQANEDRIAKSAASLDQQRSALQTLHTRAVIVERLATDDKSLGEKILAAFDATASDRSEEQLQLLKQHDKIVSVDREQLSKIAAFQTADKELENQIGQLNAQKKPEPLIRALWDRGEPSPTYLLKRGNYLTPRDEVAAGFPAVLSRGEPHIQPPWEGAQQTGRRLALAKWLTDGKQPLTARVIVNRIWKHHFENGIVASLDNFGIAGARPTHPELLDWLAVEFVENGWSIKSMQRLILNSATYQQSSQVTEEADRLDPENRLLSRMPLKRMDAEALRDSLLELAGRLRHVPFGPGDAVSKRGDGLVTSIAQNDTWRRSIYVLKRRTEGLTMLDDFDRPRMSPNCVERNVSTVAPQALHLLNNAQVQELANAMAARAISQTDNTERQLEQIYELTTGLIPIGEEQAAISKSHGELLKRWTELNPDLSENAIRHRVLTNLCHALMNSASFLYID